jgi:hypothetical protein
MTLLLDGLCKSDMELSPFADGVIAAAAGDSEFSL